MNPLNWIFLFLLVSSARAPPPPSLPPDAEKTLQEVTRELELAEELAASGKREARGLIKSLSFLAGLKLGSLIHASGTLAASNSFRIFGKVVNSALSVSYGSANDLLQPLPQVENWQGEPETEVSGAETRGSIPTQVIPVTEDPLPRIRQEFIAKHNQQVDRLNNRFLKSDFT